MSGGLCVEVLQGNLMLLQKLVQRSARSQYSAARIMTRRHETEHHPQDVAVNSLVGRNTPIPDIY